MCLVITEEKQQNKQKWSITLRHWSTEDIFLCGIPEKPHR